jgi:Domain of unknown function (DUF4349)
VSDIDKDPSTDRSAEAEAVDDHDATPDPADGAAAGGSRRKGLDLRGLASSLARRRLFGPAAALVVVGALVGAAWIVGNPAADSAANFAANDSLQRAAGYADTAATAGPAVAAPIAAPGDGSTSVGNVYAASTPGTGGTGQNLADLVAPQIVKTGQITLEVADLDKALDSAQKQVAGLGGTVSQSSRSGTGPGASATVTYQVPVARWNEAVTDLEKVGAKILSEQTSTDDVTRQVVDLDARLSNLKSTEAALQTIMARASAIPDVIAVEQNLSDTQGQIEELTAQRQNLANQAAMSTLAVTYQLPSETVVVQATNGWDLGAQIDQAGAALVRIGQGLATIAVWAVVVGLPLVAGLLVMLALLWIARRARRGGRRQAAQPQA